MREPSVATHKEGTSKCDARDRGEARSSAETLLPTFEGKVVAEFQPPVEHAHGMSTGENAGAEAQEKVGGALADTNAGNGPLAGSPANASIAPETYNRSSQAAQMGKNDVDSEEQRTTRPHNMPRKYLNSKSNPISKPKFDADSFEDPACDEFWKGIWVACAAHNVRVCRIFQRQTCHRLKFHVRPRSSAAFFMSYQTTSLLLGSITRILWHIMSAFSSRYASRSYPDCHSFLTRC